MVPSQQKAFMSQVAEGDLENILPPDAETLGAWRCLYLCYFNSDLSMNQGRKMSKKYCVRNPRPVEIADALANMGIQYVIEGDKEHPIDQLHPGRIKFKLHEPNGDLADKSYKCKK